jgi:hypothetical protein
MKEQVLDLKEVLEVLVLVLQEHPLALVVAEAWVAMEEMLQLVMVAMEAQVNQIL